MVVENFFFISYWLVCWLLILTQTLLRSLLCVFEYNRKFESNDALSSSILKNFPENKVKWVAEGRNKYWKIFRIFTTIKMRREKLFFLNCCTQQLFIFLIFRLKTKFKFYGKVNIEQKFLTFFLLLALPFDSLRGLNKNWWNFSHFYFRIFLSFVVQENRMFKELSRVIDTDFFFIFINDEKF